MKRNRDLAPNARAVVNSNQTHAPANMPHTMAMATRPSNEAFSADAVGLTEPRSEMKVTALAASADGKHLASGLENGQATLWTMEPAKARGLGGEAALAGVTASAHHPARRLVAVAGSLDGRPVIRVVKLDGGTVAATLPGHDGGTTALAFSADGGRVVSWPWSSVGRAVLGPQASYGYYRFFTLL